MRPAEAFADEVSVSPRGLLFDLDDTLLTHGRLTSRAYAALWAMHDAGLKLVGVTGRPAGWAEVLVRQWPVDGIVAENGALAVWMKDGRISLDRRANPDEAAERAERLGDLVREVARHWPELELADDVPHRRTDVAWDIGEHHSVDAAIVKEVSEHIGVRGARVTSSSVHLHATFDIDDKASGALRFLSRALGEEPGAARHAFAFVGDSRNDAACFAAFSSSFGVANVRAHASRLSVLPRYVARRERGEGFAEVADILIRARSTTIRRHAPNKAAPSPSIS